MENREKHTWQILKDENGYYFQNELGFQTKRVQMVSVFSDGFAWVFSGDKHFYFDEYGDFSEEFSFASSYRNGYSYVAKEEIDGDRKKFRKFKLRNTNGELSAFDFTEDYAKYVISEQNFKDCARFFDSSVESSDEKDPKKSTGYLGRASKSASEQKIYSYYNYRSTIYDLTPEEILANLDKIQAFEENNYLMALAHCQTEQEKQALRENYLVIAEYIKQTAYEAKVKLENDRKVQAKRAKFAEKQLF